jgi:ribosomal protein L24
MKYLSILIVLFISACSNPAQQAYMFRFKFGDRVYVPSGFYIGTKGRIIQCWYYTNEEIYCDVDATLVSVDGRYTKNQVMTFKEKDLIEDLSN